ncbi:DUF1684 domain-containing protein [Arthrobacter echini]|uniref:DUF1684 domain-containing protein n=1 Tax=Arthrobacter echini TaxID=1529066 RepID=A0A4S5EAD5_9MICC|nr:DUF1684 domain-containing protein [Arthrobacter echini]THJ68572.1 DUF1684 domain-containing protein [Arthrobacter echini]
MSHRSKTKSTDTGVAEELWQQFRAARTASLREPHGWLTLTSLQWLDETCAAMEIVPGLWSATGDRACLTASTDDGLTELRTGRRVAGTVTAVLDDEESLFWVSHGGKDGDRIVVELARRAGRYAIRTRDAESPTLTGFTGVPVFGYRPDLVLEGRFEPYPAPLVEPIRTAHPAVQARHTGVGDVVFALPSLPEGPREVRLRAARDDTGSLSITFHDATNGSTTALWRRLTTPPPAPDGAVVLDFNRAINYPSAFTPFGTCPMPVSSNTVDAPIEAGERQPTGIGPAR